MSLIVNTNLSAISTQREISLSRAELKTSMERLSSGRKINSASDDSAGFAIAERMTAQIRGVDMAVKNVSDTLSYLRVIDDALASSLDIMQRINELTLQAANDTLSDADRTYIQKEIGALVQEIDRIGTHTKFNDSAVFKADFQRSQQVQVGANSGETVSISIGPLASRELWGAKAGYAMWADAPFMTQVTSDPQPNGLEASSFQISSSKGSAVINVAADENAASIEQTINAATDTTGVFARARTWGFLEAGSATFGETVTLSVNGESITVDDFSYMRLANAINDVRDTSGAGAYAEDWGVQIEDWSGGDISVELESNSEIYAYAPWGWDDRVSLDAGGADSVTWGGSLKLMSDDSFTVDKVGGNVPSNFDANPRSLEGTLVQSLSDNDSLTSYFDPTYGMTDNLGGSNVEYGAGLANAVARSTIDQIVAAMTDIGATINRLEYTASNLMSVSDYTTAARSRIEDANFAAESARLAKAQVLQQTGLAMLSQANAAPQLVLSLIR